MGVKVGGVVLPASPRLTPEHRWTRETPWPLVAAGPSFAGKGDVENVCGRGELKPVSKRLRETWGLVTGTAWARVPPRPAKCPFTTLVTAGQLALAAAERIEVISSPQH